MKSVWLNSLDNTIEFNWVGRQPHFKHFDYNSVKCFGNLCQFRKIYQTQTFQFICKIYLLEKYCSY